MAWHRWQSDDLILTLKVVPRSRRNGFGDVIGDAIRLRITAPPVHGKANRHLVTWLAKQFGVVKAAVRIEAGELSGLKRVRITSPARLPDTLGPVKT